MQIGPQAIADLFAAPPADTRRLLDPGNSAATPPWPLPVAPAPPPEWALTQETTLGAWSVYLVLAHGGDLEHAGAFARSWIGDRFWVYGGTGASSATAMVWRIAFVDDGGATLAEQSFSARFSLQSFGAQFTVQRIGTEVVVAATDAAVPLEWAFAVPAQNVPAPAGDGVELATESSVSDWLARILIRAD